MISRWRFHQSIEYVDLRLQKSGGRYLRVILKEFIVKVMGVNIISQRSEEYLLEQEWKRPKDRLLSPITLRNGKKN